MLDKFKTLLSDKKDVKEEEFEASQLAVASLMVTTALHDGEFDEIEKDEILKLLGNFYKLDNDTLQKNSTGFMFFKHIKPRINHEKNITFYYIN